MTSRSPEVLRKLFESKSVVELSDIQAALDDASRATAFRYLKQVPYRRSYNLNGRYYTRHDPARYDRLGLFSHKGIIFSRDGNLASTLLRLVQEAEAGRTQRELRELLRVRVQVLLLQALRRGAIVRERVEKLFVYFHTDPLVQQSQLQHRRELIAVAAAEAEAEITDAVIIEVLLTLIRHPASKAADVVRHLRGYSPPISMQQVRIVFDRYDLDNIGKKGGPSTC